MLCNKKLLIKADTLQRACLFYSSAFIQKKDGRSSAVFLSSFKLFAYYLTIDK